MVTTHCAGVCRDILISFVDLKGSNRLVGMLFGREKEDHVERIKKRGGWGQRLTSPLSFYFQKVYVGPPPPLFLRVRGF